MSTEHLPTIDLSVDRRMFFKEKVPAIIDSITGYEQPRWGMMSVHHMLEHLVLPIKFVTGEIIPPLFTPEEKLESRRRGLESAYAMPQNFKFPMLPTDELSPLVTANLDEAKVLLKDYVQRFLNTIEDPGFTTMLQPIFGHLDKEGWLLFQYKHFCHHFTQFGLLSSN